MKEQSKNQLSIKKIAFLGMFVCFALILSYIEFLIPFDFKIPGAKLGLANLSVLFVLYKMGIKEAYIVNILRILLSSLLFAGFYGFIYSIAGALLSLCVMALLTKTKHVSCIGAGVTGGVTHNLAQLLVAVLISGAPGIVYYLPFLMAFGAVAGFIVGLINSIILRRLSNVRIL